MLEMWETALQDNGFEKPSSEISLGVFGQGIGDKFLRKYARKLLRRIKEKGISQVSIRCHHNKRMADILATEAWKFNMTPVEVATETKFTKIGYSEVFKGYEPIGKKEGKATKAKRGRKKAGAKKATKSRKPSARR